MGVSKCKARIRTRASLLFMVACVLGASADDIVNASDKPEEFTCEQEVILPEGDNPYVSIELGPSQYAVTRKDLGDVRVIDSLGRYCPYIIDSARDYGESEHRSYPTKAIGISEVKNEGETIAYADFQVIDYAEGLEANILEVSTSSPNFSLRVDILARSAKSEWEYVSTDTIYRIEGVEKLLIELPDMPLYQFWRVSVQAPFPLSDPVFLPRLDRQKQEVRRYAKDVVLPLDKPSIGQKGYSTYDVLNDSRLRVMSLSFDPSGFFKRSFEIRSEGTVLAQKVLYRIPAQGSVVSDLRIELSTDGSAESLLRIIVRDGDDSPLELPSVTVQYAIDYLVFRPTGSPPYSLQYGNDQVAPPLYDLKSYREDILSHTIPQARLGAPVVTEAAQQSSGMSKTLFTIIVLGTAVILGLISLFAILTRKDAS